MTQIELTKEEKKYVEVDPPNGLKISEDAPEDIRETLENVLGSTWETHLPQSPEEVEEAEEYIRKNNLEG